MRALVVWPSAGWAVADVARGWAAGLAGLGVETYAFRLDSRLEWLEEANHKAEMGCSLQDLRRMAAESLHGAIFDCDPDLVVVVSGGSVPPETYRALKERGVRVVIIHTESPYEDVRQVAMHWCADLHLMNDPVGVEHMKQFAEHVYYVRHAYDPAIHHPGTEPRTGAVVFVGSGFAGRAELLAQVDWDAVGGLTLGGQWDADGPLGPWVDETLESPLPNARAADLYRSHRVGLNIYRADYIQHPDLLHGWAMGPREVEMAACGLFFLRQSRPESDAVFPMLPTFASAEELSDLASWWLTHDEAREDATAAMLAAVADRTFTNNARGLLGLVEKVWGSVDRRQPLTV